MCVSGSSCTLRFGTSPKSPSADSPCSRCPSALVGGWPARDRWAQCRCRHRLRWRWPPCPRRAPIWLSAASRCCQCRSRHGRARNPSSRGCWSPSFAISRWPQPPRPSTAKSRSAARQPRAPSNTSPRSAAKRRLGRALPRHPGPGRPSRSAAARSSTHGRRARTPIGPRDGLRWPRSRPNSRRASPYGPWRWLRPSTPRESCESNRQACT